MLIKTVVCPYCGNKNRKINIQIGKQLVRCEDYDTPGTYGCDRHFVIELDVPNPVFTTYKIAEEGTVSRA